MLKDKNWLPLSFYSIDNFLSSWRKEKAIKKSFNDFTKEELEYILRRFYVKARSHNGKYYSRNSTRVGMDRYLNNENINFSIITDIEFKVADDAMNAHLIEPDREGKIRSMKHKPALVPRDVELLHEKKLLGLETPESLLQTAWFNIVFHFGNPQIKQRPRMHHKSWKGHEKPPKGPIYRSENEAVAVMSEMPGAAVLVVLC